MKPEEIRIAVAELDGYRLQPRQLEYGVEDSHPWVNIVGTRCRESQLPRYTTSHDVIHGAVTRWCDEDPGRRAAWSNALHEIAGKRPGTPMNSGNRPVVSDYHRFMGPALEWATALVKASGKWVAT